MTFGIMCIFTDSVVSLLTHASLSAMHRCYLHLIRLVLNWFWSTCALLCISCYELIE